MRAQLNLDDIVNRDATLTTLTVKPLIYSTLGPEEDALAGFEEDLDPGGAVLDDGPPLQQRLLPLVEEAKMRTDAELAEYSPIVNTDVIEGEEPSLPMPTPERPLSTPRPSTR